MTRPIPGMLDLHALALLSGITYEQRASQHRPDDPHALATEIRRLAASGLRRRDISVALRLPLDAVVNALAGHGDAP